MKFTKNRLFDFSAATAVISVSAYAFILALFGYNFFATDKKAAFGIAFAVAAATLALIVIKFVFRAAIIDGDAVRCGKLAIKRDDIRLLSVYDIKFREATIILKDVNTDYDSMPEKQRSRMVIRVQATESNCKKLSEYLGCVIRPAAKPRPAKKAKKAKNKKTK